MGRHWPASLFTAFKYVWRVGKKDEVEQEVKKALWYLNDYKENPPPIEDRVKNPPNNIAEQLACLQNEFPPQQGRALTAIFLVRYFTGVTVDDAIREVKAYHAGL